MATKMMAAQTPPGDVSMREWAEQLVARSRAEGVDLVGSDGLLTALMRTVLQTGMEVEMTEHLGYEAHDPAGRGSGNSRNGSYPKTVATEIGDIELRVPRDRNATFEPVTVPKHVRRLDGLNANVLSLYAKGLTTGEIAAHLHEIYGTEISRDTISRITDAVIEEMTAWQNRPLDRVYPVVLIDAIVVKVRDSQVANRPVYVAIGVNLDGERDVLGLWLGPTGSEGAKQWMSMLTELRNRGPTVTAVFAVSREHATLRRGCGPHRIATPRRTRAQRGRMKLDSDPLQQVPNEDSELCRRRPVRHPTTVGCLRRRRDPEPGPYPAERSSGLSCHRA